MIYITDEEIIELIWETKVQDLINNGISIDKSEIKVYDPLKSKVTRFGLGIQRRKEILFLVQNYGNGLQMKENFMDWLEYVDIPSTK